VLGIKTAENSRSPSIVQTRVINRNYFEELAWRYFVCVELRTHLPFLNRYNFKQNLFERYLAFLIASVICNYRRRTP
jgi:hypothetical protein